MGIKQGIIVSWASRGFPPYLVGYAGLWENQGGLQPLLRVSPLLEIVLIHDRSALPVFD